MKHCAFILFSYPISKYQMNFSLAIASYIGNYGVCVCGFCV